MACTGCGNPCPCPFRLRDADGVHARCVACVLELAAAVQRVGTEIELTVRRPAPVMA